MAVPTITVECAFTSSPLDLGSVGWTDISAYVRAIDTKIGRSYEVNRIEAGTATIVLDNADRRFDPTNTSGPYYGYLLPMRYVRITAVWDSVTYYLFTGFVEAWEPRLEGGLISELHVPLVDAFTYFARKKITLSHGSAERSDLQIDRILDYISWPLSILETGKSTMEALDMDNEAVLTRLQAIAESENGSFYMFAGIAIFRDRHYRLMEKSASSATFGDADGELPYEELILSYDDSLIYNDIRVTHNASSTVSIATDTTSENKYFSRTLEKTSYVNDVNETLDAANWLLAQYKEPGVRARRLTTSGYMDDTIWLYVLSLLIDDRLTVKQRPPGGGNVIIQDCYIESIRHVIDHRPESDAAWRTIWELSPAQNQSYWILGDATLSILDSTTVLGY